MEAFTDVESKLVLTRLTAQMLREKVPGCEAEAIEEQGNVRLHVKDGFEAACQAVLNK